MLAALEGDGLTPLVRPGLSGAVGQGDRVVPGGGGGDNWREERGREERTSFLVEL